MSKWITQIAGRMKDGMRGLFEPAVDPAQQFANPLERQQELLGRIRGALRETDAAAQRIARRCAELRNRMSALEQEARLALSQGDEARARAILFERLRIADYVDDAEAQLAALNDQSRRLSSAEQRLLNSMNATADRMRAAAACANAAEARTRVHETLNMLAASMEELQDSIREAENHAAAADDLATAFDTLSERAERRAYHQRAATAAEREMLIDIELAGMRHDAQKKTL